MAAKYAAYAKIPAAAMAKQLAKYQDHDPDHRVLVFSAEERTAVEKLFGKPIERVKEFVDFFTSCLTSKVGGAEIPLTASQKKRVEGMAGFWKQDPKELLVTLIKQAITNRLGA